MAFTVIIVDDEHPIRFGMQHWDRWPELGFEVIGTASNGAAALELMRQRPADLLMTDIRMPVMDGIELIRNVREAAFRTEIIVLSGYGDFAYTQKAIEFGVFAYLLKPVKDDDLNQVMARLVERLSSGRPPEGPGHGPGLPTTDSVPDQALSEYYMVKLLTESPDKATSYFDKLRAMHAIAGRKYFCVVAVSFHAGADKELITWLMYESDWYWKGRDCLSGFQNGRMFILFTADNRDMAHQIQNELKRYKAALLTSQMQLAKGRFQVAAGIGDVCDRIPALRDSVDGALKALSMSFYLGLDEIILFRQIKPKIIPSVDRGASKKLIDEIAASLLAGDYCSTAARIRALYAWILAQGYYEVDLLIMKSLEIYQAFLAQTEKLQLDLVLPDETAMFAQFRNCLTYGEFIQSIEQPLGQLAQEIARKKNDHDNELCVQVKKYIADNYNKKVTLKEISEAFNLNPTYMSTYFKEKTGVNLFKYLLNVRIAAARDLLKNSSLQITEISDQVGFSDYRYFCTAFKKETGFTPLKYRLKKYI